MSRVLISILNWNNSAGTLRCLESLAKIDESSRPDIYLSDNGSVEPFELPRNIASSFRFIKVVYNKTNLGTSKAHNLAFAYALEKKYDYFGCLNNDAEVIDTDLFKVLVEELEDNPGAVAITPTMLSSLKPKEIWFGGGGYNEVWGNTYHRQTSQKESRSEDFLTTCCILIRLASLPNELKSYCEKYFVYWEDSEWSIVARKLGRDLIVTEKVQILHAVSSTLGIHSPTYIYYNLRNNFIFVRRNTPRLYRPLAYSRIYYIALKYVLLSLIKPNKTSRLRAIMFALNDGFRDKGGAWQG